MLLPREETESTFLRDLDVGGAAAVITLGGDDLVVVV